MLKRIIFLMITVVALSSCGLYKGQSINDLQLGTTKQQVDSQFGYPLRMLSMGNVGGVYSEVYEYKISRSVYALEYVGNRLNHVEFMYDYDDYYPTNPPNYKPSPGRPGGGGSNVRPPSTGGNTKPQQPSRPGTGGSTGRPPSGGSQDKPTLTTRPAETTPADTSNSRPSTTRPSGSRESSTSTSSGRSSSSTEQRSSTSTETSTSESSNVRTRSTGSSSGE